jgi:hypothetical protein
VQWRVYFKVKVEVDFVPVETVEVKVEAQVKVKAGVEAGFVAQAG